MSPPSGADHFELGEAHCLLSLLPCKDCVHCKVQPAPPVMEAIVFERIPIDPDPPDDEPLP